MQRLLVANVRADNPSGTVFDNFRLRGQGELQNYLIEIDAGTDPDKALRRFAFLRLGRLQLLIVIDRLSFTQLLHQQHLSTSQLAYCRKSPVQSDQVRISQLPPFQFRHKLPSGEDQRPILLDVHGFKTPFLRSLWRGYRLQKTFGKAVIVFSWPSGSTVLNYQLALENLPKCVPALLLQGT